MPRLFARALALPQGRPFAFPWAVPDWQGFLAQGLSREIEQRRLFPWIAVCFGLGIVLFFQAEGQPVLWAPLGGLMLCVVAAFLLRRSLAALAIMIGLAALFAGFSAGAIRTRSVAAPVLARMTITPVSGFIEAVEDRPEGKRLLLRIAEMKGVAESDRPRIVRVSVRNGEGLAAGQFIETKARLLPPPQPAWPGGYDFGRDAYFKGIGAVGSLVGPVRRVTSPEQPSWSLWLAAKIDEARNTLTQRIASSIGGPAGGVGAALVTGKRGLIGEPTNDVLRAAGIYHIVSISGLHMVLAAGTFFWLARAFLALAPALVLLWPVKKIAAVAAMAGATGYCVFSGSDVATERSLIMTLVMFGAILADRPALSIRNLSVAALIVLAREPEALLGPSFQMSFGAVAALTTFVPLMTWKGFEGRPGGTLEKGFLWMVQNALGLVTTTLVASIATAPFSAYHFQTLNPYGLIGNALALPLVSLVVMPSAVLGVLAYPFGLDRPIWQIMGFAVNHVLDVSAWVGGLSGSIMVVPALSVGALALLSAALLILTLSASSLRWLAVIPVGAGLAFAAPNRADIFVDREGAGAAIRASDGNLTVVGRTSQFVTEQWLRADGDGRNADDASLRRNARCDRSGCIVEGKGKRMIAFVHDLSAFEEDCRRAAIVITRLKAPSRCQASLLLDREALSARGATAIRFRDDATIEIRSVRKGSEVVAVTIPETRAGSAPVQHRPQKARPVPEQDLPQELPEEEISSDEPD
ncbi:ComEC/Rec2 family competence protein [Microvirga sp. 2TAF3]|uniref:ComEC/Rec2 family competence protein n=1 Tax=Microvirga sp. 2TAF3 TaxID=3233014 RepID=UPI003F9E3724